MVTIPIFGPSDSTFDDSKFFSRDDIDLSLIFPQKFVLVGIKCDLHLFKLKAREDDILSHFIPTHTNFSRKYPVQIYIIPVQKLTIIKI